MAEPIDSHWLAQAAVALDLPGASTLAVSPDDRVADVWARVTEATGLSERELADRLADRYLMSVADLSNAEPYAARLIPGIVAVRYSVLPLRYTDRTLDVATCDPHDVEAEREVSRLATRAVRFELAPPGALRAAMARAYAGAARGGGAAAPKAPSHEPAGTARAPSPSESGEAGDTRTHVLVVDDDPDTVTLLESFLAGKGFRVTSTRTGPEALEVLQQDPSVDVVSLDYYMHPMNGLKVLNSIRKRPEFDHLPVVMLTSSEDRNIEMSVFEAGADDYVVKPLDPPRYFLRLRAVMRRRSGG